MADKDDKKKAESGDETTPKGADATESSAEQQGAEADKASKPAKKPTRRRRSAKKKDDDKEKAKAKPKAKAKKDDDKKKKAKAKPKAKAKKDDDKKKKAKAKPKAKKDDDDKKKAKAKKDDDDKKKAKAKKDDDDKKKAKAKKDDDDGKKKKSASKKAVHFITGFPGFIGSRLIEKLALEDDKAEFILLVEARILDRAQKSLAQLESEIKGFGKRSRLVTGDITREHLGIEPKELDGVLNSVTTVWHLAAIYDLAVEAQFAYRVNVVGTSNVLDFCEACKSLKRLNYVSTCYVSGDRTGLILETELDEGQGHKNHYERTKFWAEVEVQRRMDRIPTAIYRPGIVVGDSKTGQTDKYDGPYYLITFLLRLPSWFPMVNVGRGDALVNLVPVDFVVDALTTLGTTDGTEGRVYQLADPNPMRARDIISLALKIMGRRPPIATLPAQLMEKVLDYQKGRQLLGMPKEAVVYFNHMARYDVTHTLESLADTPVRCPHMSTYLSTLISYVERNPKKDFLDGRSL